MNEIAFTRAQRLFQLRHLLIHLYLPKQDREAVAELADNLQKKFQAPIRRVSNG